MKLTPECNISEIPYPGLREVAIRRLGSQRSPGNRNVGNFIWLSTPEGHDFWQDVYCGKYDGRFEKQTLRRI